MLISENKKPAICENSGLVLVEVLGVNLPVAHFQLTADVRFRGPSRNGPADVYSRTRRKCALWGGKSAAREFYCALGAQLREIIHSQIRALKLRA